MIGRKFLTALSGPTHIADNLIDTNHECPLVEERDKLGMNFGDYSLYTINPE